jgi:hypothetical protein
MPNFEVGQLYKLSIKPNKNSGSETVYDTFESEEKTVNPSNQEIKKYVFKKNTYTEEQILSQKPVTTTEALQPFREESLEKTAKAGRRKRKTRTLHKKRKQHKRHV